MSGPAPHRRLYLDEGVGETRGVVLLEGRPERLLISRDGDSPIQPGARLIARVRRIERRLASAFLDLGEDPEGVIELAGAARGLSEGLAVEVEVSAPARGARGPVMRLIGPAQGAPTLIAPAPSVKERLQAFAPALTLDRGEAAREAADTAEAEALAIEHPLGQGATLAVETTRGLTAVDVDAGAAAGQDARRMAAQLNRRAVGEGARLLRLKGLGGLVVFDLVGAGQDGPALAEAARSAFAPDMPGVVFGPVSRLGVLHLALPWRSRPIADRVCDLDGRLSPASVALRLVRAIEREARHATRVYARCAPEVEAAASALKPALVARLGPRFDIQADPARARTDFDVRPI